MKSRCNEAWRAVVSKRGTKCTLCGYAELVRPVVSDTPREFSHTFSLSKV